MTIWLCAKQGIIVRIMILDYVMWLILSNECVVNANVQYIGNGLFFFIQLVELLLQSGTKYIHL